VGIPSGLVYQAVSYATEGQNCMWKGVLNVIMVACDLLWYFTEMTLTCSAR
jgi:hypothetical protein